MLSVHLQFCHGLVAMWREAWQEPVMYGVGYD